MHHKRPHECLNFVKPKIQTILKSFIANSSTSPCLCTITINSYTYSYRNRKNRWVGANGINQNANTAYVNQFRHNSTNTKATGTSYYTNSRTTINNNTKYVKPNTIYNTQDSSPSTQQQPQHQLYLHDHNHTHFVRGGTPCDPAPPPFLLADYGDESLYTLVLLRHGESEWNSQNRYTGWCDVNLTRKGEEEAKAAGRLLTQNKIELDHVFTSVLNRAINTTNIALTEAGQHWVPITKSWRLNERHYGALQGYNKDTAYEELGFDQELVMEMRRSYSKKPPTMEDDHPFWHGHDRRYKHLSKDQLEKTRTESLQDTADRILPFYQSQIIPSLCAGNKCMIVSHANSLRSLIKQIDNISDEDIKGMSIPTGIPLLYRLDKNMKPVDPKVELEVKFMIEPKGYTWGTSRQYGFHGVYLGDLKRLQEIQMKRDASNRDWQRIILRNIAIKVCHENFAKVGTVSSDGVMTITHLYFQIHKKTQEKEQGNMLLLVRMKKHLEQLMNIRKQRYLTMEGFEAILNKLHLDTEGRIVEPFVNLESGSKKWEGL